MPIFSWSPAPKYGSLNPDLVKHGPMRKIKRQAKVSLFPVNTIFLDTHLHERIEVGVVSHNGYLRAIKAHLIVDSIFELYKYVQILMESGVFVAIMILWLGAGQLMFSTTCFHYYTKTK